MICGSVRILSKLIKIYRRPSILEKSYVGDQFQGRFRDHGYVAELVLSAILSEWCLQDPRSAICNCVYDIQHNGGMIEYLS